MNVPEEAEEQEIRTPCVCEPSHHCAMEASRSSDQQDAYVLVAVAIVPACAPLCLSHVSDVAREQEEKEELHHLLVEDHLEESPWTLPWRWVKATATYSHPKVNAYSDLESP